MSKETSLRFQAKLELPIPIRVYEYQFGKLYVLYKKLPIPIRVYEYNAANPAEGMKAVTNPYKGL